MDLLEEIMQNSAIIGLGGGTGFLCDEKDSTKTRIQIPARQYCGPLRIRRQR